MAVSAVMLAVSAVVAVADIIVDDGGDGMALAAKAPAPKVLHPLAGEVVDVQQRLPPLRISLDPLE